jgi:hypothetical protein
MQKRVVFLASDAWLLLAILYAGGAEAASLRAIIAAADFINHAILSYEELAGGLERLARAGAIRRQGEDIRPSPAVRAYYEKVSRPQGRVHKDLELISGYLRAGSPAGPADHRDFAGLVDRAAFERAVEDYLNSVRS